MSIEFQCTSCQRQLRVADALGGKRGKCPHCGSLIQVPTSSPARSTAATSHSQATRGTSAGNVVVTCPRCSQSIMAPASLIGQQGACPHCQTVMIVGGGAASSPSVSPQAAAPTSYSAVPHPGVDPFGGGYAPLGGDNDLFGGVPAYTPPAPSPYGAAAPASNPYGYAPAASSWGGSPAGNPYGAQAPNGYSSGYGRQSAPSRWAPPKLMVPVILNLIVMVTLTFVHLYNIVKLIFAPMTYQYTSDPSRVVVVQIILLLIHALYTLVNVTAITGLVNMLILRRYELARIGGIAACLPCSMGCINFLLGVWVMMILNQADVRQRFR